MCKTFASSIHDPNIKQGFQLAYKEIWDSALSFYFEFWLYKGFIQIHNLINVIQYLVIDLLVMKMGTTVIVEKGRNNADEREKEKVEN